MRTNGNTPLVYDETGASHGVVLAKGEVVPDLSTGQHRIGDGVTPGGLPQVAQFPKNAYSALAAGYVDALHEFDAWAWDAGNNHLRHTSTDVGGPQFGVPDDTLPTFCMWMAWQASFVYYEGWRLATTPATADPVTAAFCLSRFQAHWAHVKASYSPQALKTGDSSSGGGKWVAYVLDDAAIHLRGLHAVADVYGASSAEGQLAIGYMVEFLPYALQYFRDTYATNPTFDSGVITPGGTAFRWNTYGALYGHPGDTSYDHASSLFEAWIADEAVWLSKRVGSGASAPTTAMAAALVSYAKNVWEWQQLLKTPLSAGDTRTVANFVAGSSLCMDPNAAAKNTNPAVNGGNSATGRYDTNKKFKVAINWYYGQPLRAATSLWDAGAQGYIAMSCALAGLAGADPKYAASALTCASAYCDPTGFGRVRHGIPLIGNLQDPHSNGVGWPRMMRALAGLPGFNRSSLLVQSAINTARKLIATRQNGRMTPDWAGPERNFVHDATRNLDYTWEHELAAGGGGVQASRDQIMVPAGGLNLTQAALQFRDVEVSLGSGATGAAAIDQLISMVQSAMLAGAEAMSVLGGNFLGPISFGDGSLRIGPMPAMGFDANNNSVVADAGLYPTIQLNDHTYVRCNLALARIELWIAGKVVFFVGADGTIGLPGGENAAGDVAAGGKVFAGGSAQLYIGLIYGFPGLNLGAGNYILFNTSKNRLEFSAGGQTAATLDTAGNLRLRGTSTPSLGAGIDS